MFTMQHRGSPSAEKSRLRNLAICKGRKSHNSHPCTSCPTRALTQTHHGGLKKGLTFLETSLSSLFRDVDVVHQCDDEHNSDYDVDKRSLSHKPQHTLAFRQMGKRCYPWITWILFKLQYASVYVKISYFNKKKQKRNLNMLNCHKS